MPDLEFEVSLRGVCALTPTRSSWSKSHAYISTHKHHTRHEHSCPAVGPVHRGSPTSPSSTISFVFGQMQCSRPGGSNTQCGTISFPLFFILQLPHQICPQRDGFPYNLRLSFCFFLPWYKDKFVFASVIALDHLSTPPDNMKPLIQNNEAPAVVNIMAFSAFSHFLCILHWDDQINTLGSQYFTTESSLLYFSTCISCALCSSIT